jgi:Holliday junction DNA helicase RuvA
MILELCDRVIKLIPQGEREESKEEVTLDTVREDALSALVNLGYKKSVARVVLERVLDGPGERLVLEEALKRALKELS